MATETDLTNFARQNRRNPTEYEKHLWRHLSNRQLAGHKFRRQHKFAPYIADCFCPAKGLVVELDGATHDDPSRDDQRTAFLEAQGYRVLRFWNNDVMTNLDGVLDALSEALATAPLPNPLPGGERA